MAETRRSFQGSVSCTRVSVIYVWHQMQRAKIQCFQGTQRFAFSGRADAFQMQKDHFQMQCSYGENCAVFRLQIACVPLFPMV